ncbi:hypothetical protein [Pseudomonas sp. Hp2]|uniref:hypothetical protein n=1 Tax=Pseudomonas sp. Hp2 TaxID=701189 RepID=UPI00112D17B0|nr:hypothetical protein [Pseudomonas sp. Hp2]
MITVHMPSTPNSPVAQAPGAIGVPVALIHYPRIQPELSTLQCAIARQIELSGFSVLFFDEPDGKPVVHVALNGHVACLTIPKGTRYYVASTLRGELVRVRQALEVGRE